MVEIRSKLSAQDRIDFNRNIGRTPGGSRFSKELLSELEENYRTATEEAKRNKKVEDLLRDASRISDKGEVIGKAKSRAKGYRHYYRQRATPSPMTFTTLLDDIATIPPAYQTGYSSLDEFVGFTLEGSAL